MDEFFKVKKRKGDVEREIVDLVSRIRDCKASKPPDIVVIRSHATKIHDLKKEIDILETMLRS